METIAFQTELRPTLPVVFRAKDYREFRETVKEVDHFLTATGIEHYMLVPHLISEDDACSKNRNQKAYKRLRQAFRYAILLALTGLSHRALSHRVADSALFQWFTHTSEIDGFVFPPRAALSVLKSFEFFVKPGEPLAIPAQPMNSDPSAAI